MEDRKTALAVIMAIVVIVVYTQYVMEPYMAAGRRATPATTQTSSREIANQNQPVTNVAPSSVVPPAPASTTGGTPGATPKSAATVTGPTTVVAHTPEQFAAHQQLTVRTDTAIISFTALGGRITSYQLIGYNEEPTAPRLVDLVNVDARRIYPLGVWIGTVNDGDVVYSFEGIQFDSGREKLLSVSGSQTFTLTLRGSLPDGSVVRKSVTFRPDTYLDDVHAAVESGPSLTQPIWLEWSYKVPTDLIHAARLDRYAVTGVKSLSTDNKITSALATELPIGASPIAPARWISLQDKYFIVALIPPASAPSAQSYQEVTATGEQVLSIRVGGIPGSASTSMYVGPKNSQILEDSGADLYRSIDLGTFSFLAFPLLWLLRFFHTWLNNWGLAIIVLTIALKTAFLPLTKMSFKSMAAMQELQPEMKALRERITDPTQLNQEMMALYRRKGVNPMGGCFPILLQIPVFLGLYNALLNAIELRHAPFAVWIQDLSSPEHCLVGGVSIPIMVFVLGVTMFIQQWITPTGNMDPLQRKIMMIVPLILVISFIVYPIPAGLVLYWVVNNTMSIVQQSVIRSDKRVTPFQATLLGGIGLFGVGFVLTLI